MHDIGKSLLITILSNNGYTVHDLGKQVPVNTIVEAAIETTGRRDRPVGAAGSTSKQMPLCIQELDRTRPAFAGADRRRGDQSRLRPPRGGPPDDGVLRAGRFLLQRRVRRPVDDGRADRSRARRDGLVQQVREEIAAERDQGRAAASRGSCRGRAPGPRRDVAVPDAAVLGRPSVTRRSAGGLAAPRLATRCIATTGAATAPKATEYDRIVSEVFEPQLAELQAEALRDGWLEPLIVSGYFPCSRTGSSLIIYDPRITSARSTRLDFPRQADGERLCLADYFRPVELGEKDVVVLQAVSTGPRASALVEELQQSGDYSRMLYVNGLASGTAEALADYAHVFARNELGLPTGQGLRFSWGYPACPDRRGAAQDPAAARCRGRDRADAQPERQPGSRTQHRRDGGASPRSQVLRGAHGRLNG